MSQSKYRQQDVRTAWHNVKCEELADRSSAAYAHE